MHNFLDVPLPDPNSIDDSTLARYLSGECSDAEVAAIEQRLASDAALRARVDSLRTAWEVASRRPTTIDLAAERGRLRRAAHRGASRTARVGPRVLAPGRLGVVGGAAAAAILALIVWTSRREPPRGPDPLQREVATKLGQSAQIFLSDGTRVLLSPGSHLRFASPFADTARDVTLDGRALFDVAHDTVRRFRVHTAVGVAEDVGTSFSVTQFAGDSVLQVVVS